MGRNTHFFFDFAVIKFLGIYKLPYSGNGLIPVGIVGITAHMN